MGRVTRFFQRFGSVGSIARWAWHRYEDMKALRPELSEREIAQELWSLRYQLLPPKPSEAARFRSIRVDAISGLSYLCLAVIFVEMDVSPIDGQIYRDAAAVVDQELERLRGPSNSA